MAGISTAVDASLEVVSSVSLLSPLTSSAVEARAASMTGISTAVAVGIPSSSPATTFSFSLLSLLRISLRGVAAIPPSRAVAALTLTLSAPTVAEAAASATASSGELTSSSSSLATDFFSSSETSTSSSSAGSIRESFVVVSDCSGFSHGSDTSREWCPGTVSKT